MAQSKKNLKEYMEVLEKPPEVDSSDVALTIIVESSEIVDPDILDLPHRDGGSLLESEPPPAPIITETQEMFYQRLLERISEIPPPPLQTEPQPISVTVETTEAHVERLFTIEGSMLSVLKECLEVAKKDSLESRSYLKEESTNTKNVINKIVETQQKIIASQDAMVIVLSKLSEKIAEIAANPISVNPIVNVPAPIVNITESNNRRVTKLVQRDESGLITKVIEDTSSDEV